MGLRLKKNKIPKDCVVIKAVHLRRLMCGASNDIDAYDDGNENRSEYMKKQYRSIDVAARVLDAYRKKKLKKS